MKKIVVVVGGGKIVTFEGEKLKVSNNRSEGGLLIIQDMSRDVDTRQLAVFRSWRYWREVDDVGSEKKETEITYGKTDKVRIINKKGLCVAVLYILPDGNLADDSWLRSKALVEKKE